MANRLQLKRGTGAPGNIFYEGEPIFDKSNKVLYVGDNGGTGSGTGSIVASYNSYAAVNEILYKSSSSEAASIRLYEDTDNGTDYVKIKAPDSLASTYTLTLPENDGDANQVLKTDGSGNLSWASSAVSSFTEINVSGQTTITADQSGDSLTFAEGEGIDITTNAGSDTITISAELASSINAGVASFDSTDFTVSGLGTVTLNSERVEDIIGAMVSSNSESGISVTYDDTNGKLDFDVADFSITLNGDVTGIATVTNLGNVTITAAIAAGSVDLGTDTSGDYVASITSGDGLTGGASGSGSTPTLAVGAGTGITVNADDVALKNAGNLTNDTVVGWSTASGQVVNAPLTYSGNDVTVAGDLVVAGNDIKSNGGTTAITLSGANVTIAGDLTVVGSAVTFQTEIVKVEDRLLELGLVGGEDPSTSTTWDSGVVFNYHDGTSAKKSAVIWLDNTFVAFASSITTPISGNTGTTSADPQVTVSQYAPIIASSLYLGGTNSGTDLVINSSKEAVNLIFDGGTYS